MAIAFIDSTAIYDGSGVASPPMDSTGANLLVALYVDADGVEGTISDSKSNSWTLGGPVVVGFYNMWVAYCHSPTVGSGHTFTVTGLVGAVVGVLAFSGAAASGSFDSIVADGTLDAGTVQPGSLTPVANNEVLCSLVFGGDGNAFFIDSGFTEVEDITSPANLALAYKIQTTAGAENPSWSSNFWSSGDLSASMAAFKASATGGLPAMLRSIQAVRRASFY